MKTPAASRPASQQFALAKCSFKHARRRSLPDLSGTNHPACRSAWSARLRHPDQEIRWAHCAGTAGQTLPDPMGDRLSPALLIAVLLRPARPPACGAGLLLSSRDS